jgi:hypothetical protein
MATAHRKKMVRLSLDRFREKAKQAGWCNYGLWMERKFLDEVGRRAQLLGVTKGSVLLAAIECGFKRLTSSEIIASDRRWRQTVNQPGSYLVKRGIWKPVRDPVTGRLTSNQGRLEVSA